MKVIIIGAGWSGLVAAKTYLQLAASEKNPRRHPLELTILDDNESLGGVWSSSRLYPGLIANSPNGLYEYSDFSMVDDAHPDLGLISGKRVQEYLEAYAKHFNVFDKIRFGVKVVNVHRRSDSNPELGWIVETSTGESLECDKLIVSSGMHSKPKLPELARSPRFKGVSVHSKVLGQTYEKLATDPTVQDVVVVGGCKSAIEAIGLFLDAPTPKRIHWLVRPSEQGVPLVVVDPDARPNLVAVFQSRLASIFSPSIFSTTGFWYNFLHSGRWILGTLLLNLYWAVASIFIKSTVDYGRSQNGRLIEPEGNSLFYDPSYVGVVLKGSRFLKALHGNDSRKFEVHRARLLEVREKTLWVQEKVVLDHGQGWYMRKQEVKADAIIWCTGWESSMDFFSDTEKARLGLPRRISSDAKVLPEDEEWIRIAKETGVEVGKTFPYLVSGNWRPRKPTEKLNTTAFRLYNQILPTTCLPSLTDNSTSDRSIAFIGFINSSQTATTSELCALYAVAWLEDLIKTTESVDQHEAMKAVSRVQSWRNVRYGPRGMRDPDNILEIQTFHDQLCRELGIQVQRKRKQGKNVFGEWFRPYRASDYAGVIDEFLQGNFEDRMEKGVSG